MNGYIQRIKTKIPNSEKDIDINVNGRNLIFTGGNGCGKTQLITFLHSYLNERIVNKQNHDEEQILRSLQHYEQHIKSISKANSQYRSYKINIDTWKKQLEDIRNPAVFVNDIEKFVIRYDEHKAVFSKFDATRQANIKESKASVSKEDLIKQADNRDTSSASLFEDYLVSHKTAQAYAESPSIDNDQDKASKIKLWFDKLETDFRELFEDKELELMFNSNSQTFFIKQKNKKPYRFQQLSSGFSSILSVYADLITRVELRSISPSDIDGVAFIDEIDAHLHVSLQRKIFAFLVKSFPNIQFIVSTHSPFVVSSVSDAVIYDLSRLEQVDDLSLYSYESVLEGLFNVLPISEVLKDKIIAISEITNSQKPNIEKLVNLISQVTPHENKLDSESAYFLKRAKATINKSKYKEA
ncbi:AAA family ATPase [Aliivibrio fischeri]|uniref:AAA family ATPase n=1 Tax=Aliivibrio fischeri TaxID=668 RepID=UPI0007C4C597|nr:AAA family ATPase [Aliivibrio fischeri]MBP3140232.1 ATP-binding protein [Aliivibrio fischeri]MBP3154617.1 ATP-binding protein [Aliivibrio fischeri]MCE7575789.1 ATP-binding protein [Aliivibrio fischeri]